VAVAHGFEPSREGARTGLYDYADIDDEFISIHHYLKWYKFGITRLFDNLSLEIRHGRMTRERAIEVLREKGDQTPHSDIEKFCRYVNISEKRFWEIVEKFRNPAVWQKKEGRWIIADYLLGETFQS
jgi:hypothetical protein